ncbi:MAG: hypothetical protein D3926_21805 [Desulfobacteraceae bacterium]|nr:MAG: hypothetical protein D3926_21805 [Desulfobacteraceae bacterium]
MDVLRLDHYNIIASEEELEKVKAFYKALFNLTEGFRPRLPGEGAWLYAGEQAVLHLSVVDASNPDTPSNPSLAHVAFHCRGLSSLKEKLDTRGLSYQSFTIEDLDMVQIFFKDPVGILVEANFIGEQIEP